MNFKFGIRMLAGSLILAFWWAILFIITEYFFLPSTDGAYGIGVLNILRDPFVLMVAVPTAFFAGVLVSPIYWFCLRKKDLKKSITLIFIVVSLTVAIVTPINATLGFYGAFAALIISLLFVKIYLKP